ncbi:hypothetical protein BDN67DRAFT_1017842 [Paxillus ammoniavirescens]|nr:hypothetical protein BDN67DRAFT_1017842 [Paxillus ammoniavirescens]
MAMHEHDDAVQSPEGRPLHRVDKGCQRSEVEARDVEGTPNEGKERMMVTNVNEDGQLITNDEDNSPSPPLPPNHPPAPSNTTATQRRAEVAPEDKPPSVQLEGESGKASSLYVEADHVEADDADVGMVNHDHNTQQSPRRPVGMPDGDEHRPNRPTEPPDEKEGEREVDGELGEKSKVEMRADKVETKELRRGNEPRGRGGSREESKEVEAKAGDQNSKDDCQRDGRTNDMGHPTSGTSPK